MQIVEVSSIRVCILGLLADSDNFAIPVFELDESNSVQGHFFDGGS